MKDERPTDERKEPPASGTGGAGRGQGRRSAGRGSPVADGGYELSELLEALANERRRYALYYLRDGGNAELDELCRQVAAWETGSPPEAVDDRTREKIRIDLYHAQLPQLEAAGIVEFDRRHGSASYRPPPEPVERFLDYCATFDSPETIGQ